MADTTPFDAQIPPAVCGPDIEYDAEFIALERNLEAAYTDRAVGPESETFLPDWKGLAQQALALCARSHDLRVAVGLSKAWLHTDGIHGLARGMALLRSLLSEHWDCVHPRLGAQGDDAGLMRVAALRNLCDARSVLAALRAAPLVAAAGLNTLRWHDLDPARGSTYGSKQPSPGSTDATYVDAVFKGCKLETLEALHATVNGARLDVLAIEELFAQHPGVATPRFVELVASLQSIQACLAPRIAARSEQEQRLAGQPIAAQLHATVEAHAYTPALTEHAQTSARADAASRECSSLPPHGATLATLATLATNGPSGAALSRAEVIRALDQLCAYFEQQEPSSPVPWLLKRASRLTGMQFVDIVRELAPGAMPELAKFVTLGVPTTTEES